MKSQPPTNHGNSANQGEGDKASARHYNDKVREFVAEGKVDEAARDAKAFVESSPREADRAERKARKGPTGSRVSLEELMAKGRGLVDRVRPMVERATAKLRSRLNRDK